MRAFPGESHLVGFPDYPLLTRVIINQPDPDRMTLVEFLKHQGEEPHLHVLDKWIGCKSGKVFFASAGDLVGWEGAHVKSAWIDEFDECPLAAFNRAMERTRMRQGFVTVTGTPRNVAWIKQEINPEDPNVTYINFASTANPNYPQEAMEEARSRLPSWEFERLYLGLLSGMEGGNLFHRGWWKEYDPEWDMPSGFQEIIQVWDTANKTKTRNDFSVCATWGRSGGSLYLLDVYRDRLEYPDLLQKVQDLYRKYHPNRILIEDKASGTQLLQDLRRKIIPVLDVKADQDKYTRASSVTGLVHAGVCHLPYNATWKHDFIEEHSSFPDTTFDDQVDTTSHALRYFKATLDTDGRMRVITERRPNELLTATGGNRTITQGSRWTDR